VRGEDARGDLRKPTAALELPFDTGYPILNGNAAAVA
jgi:hypothetical protein